MPTEWSTTDGNTLYSDGEGRGNNGSFDSVGASDGSSPGNTCTERTSLLDVCGFGVEDSVVGLR